MKANSFFFVINFLIFSTNTIYSQTIAASSAGSYTLCNNGTVNACGSNGYGQLGNGTIDPYAEISPGSQVINIYNGTQIASGGAHCLVLKNNGTVWGFGTNTVGELGDGTNIPRTTGVQIPSLSGIVDIAAAASSSFFLKNDGTVLVTGQNDYGQLGTGNTVNVFTPQLVNITNVTAISSGIWHTLFLKNDGTVWACGNNSNGVFGNGTTISSQIPVQVNINNVAKIAAGGVNSMFIKNDGTLWGTGWTFPLGIGISGSTTTSVVQIPITGIVDISLGSYHSLFLKNDGTVWSAGNGAYGQLGNGTFSSSLTPTQVLGLLNVTEISAQFDISVFKKNDGTIWTCGFHGGGLSYPDVNLVTQITNFCLPLSNVENSLDPFTIYPNPNKGLFYIDNNQFQNAIITIFNSIGQEIYSGKIKFGLNTVKLSDISTGLFMYNMKEDGIVIKSGKILIQ